MKVKECVGCGFCCMKTPCDVARRLYPGVKYCPQLEWDGNRYICALMKLSDPVGASYRKELHAGAGCCSGLNSWRNDVKKREPELNRTLINPLPEVMQLFIACMAKNFMSSDSMSLAVTKLSDLMEQKGYAEDEIKTVCNSCIHIFKENQSSFMKGFMG